MSLLSQQSAAFHNYLEVERRLSPRTVETYLRDLASLARYVETQGLPRDASKLTLLHLRAFLAEAVQGRGSATIARKIAAIRAFFRFLQKRRFITANPASQLKTPKLRRRLPKFLTVDEAFRVMDAPAADSERNALLQLRDAALLELLYASGVRVSEVATLTPADLDLDSGVMKVLGKGNKERVVPIGRLAKEAVGRWLAVRDRCRKKSDAAPVGATLFLGRYGTALTVRQVQNIVSRYGALGSGRGDLHPHALRHSCATHLLDAGADLRTIQELLGHASLSTTQRYTHVSVDRLMAAYDAAHPLAKRSPAVAENDDD